MISMICSVGRNRELGKNNRLIWHIPGDMKFFKDTTMGHIVIMGYNTYKSLPGNLPGRRMIVLTKREILADIETVNSIDIILDKYLDSNEEVFIIGGASLYKQFLEYASKLYITEIDAKDNEADTFFPEFDSEKWNKKLIKKDVHKDIKYDICLYEKKM